MPLRCPHVLDPDATDIHGEAAVLRERGPATPIELPGQVTAWAVTDPGLLRRLLTDQRVSKDPRLHWPAWIAGEIRPDWPLVTWVAVECMGTAYGQDHRRLRSLVSAAFTHAASRRCGRRSSKSSPRCSTSSPRTRAGRRSTSANGSPTRCRSG